ncbi:MAG TPA: prephenate dehydratase domain-containing protein [Granulicella sp.]
MTRIAIQGELGSNSHMAALAMLRGEPRLEIIACSLSAEVMERVVGGDADGAVLPIENSLHGSVAEHYDLLLEQPVRIVRESLLHIRHNLIAAPGVRLEQVKRVLSHPVALAQCRRFFNQNRQMQAVPFYDTAGSVKYVVAEGLQDAAGVAPLLAAEQYGGEVLVEGIEDHAANFTRFHLILPAGAPHTESGPPNKMSLAFAVDHRPGTLVAALERLYEAKVDLTKIESRPVPGSPWEYVFYVDGRFASEEAADAAIAALRQSCRMVKELGRYVAAQPLAS